MKKVYLGFLCLSILLVSFTKVGGNYFNEEKGKEIFTKVLSVEDGNTRKSKMTIIKINHRGKKRVEKILNLVKEGTEVEKTIFFTTYPADVRGVGFLSFNYEEEGRDDDRWLYLPATKKIRRISSAASRNEFFLGTDFTYRDAEKPKMKEEKWTYIKDVMKGDVKYWEVERIVLDQKSNYSKMVSLIDQSLNLIIETKYYDIRGELLKTATVSNIKKVDGFLTALKTQMVNHQKNHQTILETESIEFNLTLEDNTFTVGALESGIID